MWKKQLIALNLALLLLGLTTAPVLAAERLENKIISQNSFNVPYVIMVDGTIFHSDRDTSGEHWSYTAENHQLTLTNYSGGSILASGDLTIFSEGNVNIVGSDGNDYGNDGIQVTGTLNFYIWNTFLSVSGGDGALGGGSAIHADKLLLFSFSDSLPSCVFSLPFVPPFSLFTALERSFPEVHILYQSQIHTHSQCMNRARFYAHLLEHSMSLCFQIRSCYAIPDHPVHLLLSTLQLKPFYSLQVH